MTSKARNMAPQVAKAGTLVESVFRLMERYTQRFCKHKIYFSSILLSSFVVGGLVTNGELI
jgi:hypothetical protein